MAAKCGRKKKFLHFCFFGCDSTNPPLKQLVQLGMTVSRGLQVAGVNFVRNG
jgi:hypothetical protein